MTPRPAQFTSPASKQPNVPSQLLLQAQINADRQGALNTNWSQSIQNMCMQARGDLVTSFAGLAAGWWLADRPQCPACRLQEPHCAEGTTRQHCSQRQKIRDPVNQSKAVRQATSHARTNVWHNKAIQKYTRHSDIRIQPFAVHTCTLIPAQGYEASATPTSSKLF
jgi:hypothetical protein